MELPHGDKLRFLVAGGANTLATLLLYWAMLPVLDPRVAYAISYAAGIVLTYTLNSKWVFRRAWTHAGLASFFVGYALQAALAYGLFLLLHAYTPVPSWLLPILVTIALLPLTFIVNRTLVHRTSPSPGPDAGSRR